MNGGRTRRLYSTLVISPAFVAETAGARLQLMCRLCMTPRDLDPHRAPKLRRYWSQDLELTFSRVTFRCRCGAHAHALRVTRPTRDSSQTLLLIESRRSVNG